MYARSKYGVVELTKKIVHKEGLSGLLRGWSAAYVRLGLFEIKYDSHFFLLTQRLYILTSFSFKCNFYVNEKLL